MRTKTKEFVQYLFHDTEDEEKAEAYLEESLPLIGVVVMSFNSTEKLLDSLLCELLSDRTDAIGLIVLQKLNFSAKVDLFRRFCDEYHRALNRVLPAYENLVTDLVEIGKLRNLVVHADWENTDHEGYTFVRLKTSGNGMQQEYVQFSSESLEKLIDEIVALQHRLSDYWDQRSEALSSRA
ncbi:MAG: hypothetical protein OEL86_16040 [Sulfuritalea sp.]|nr:hypothetical protein [Sulfuritalea sp.]